MFGRGNSTDVTVMDFQRLQSDMPLERDNAEKNRYQENFYISESSTFQQQPEPEMKVEHQFPKVCSDSRSARTQIKILIDRIHRQKMADKLADMESLIWLDHRMKTLPQVNQIKTPPQADLQVNMQNIKNIDNYLRGSSTDPTEMDPEQLPSDMPLERLERYEAEKNWYQEDFYFSESSTSQEQPEPEMKVEHQFPEVCSDSRSVRKQKKILKDRIHRQQMADKRTDLELLLWMKLKLKAFPVSLQIPASFNQIRNEWPMRPDLQIILRKMQDIKAKSKDRVLTENDLNGELGIVIQELDTLRAQRSKEQERDLDAVLDTDMGTKTLIEKFSSEFPWLFSQDQVQDSLSTLRAQFKSLENQLYDKNNNKVSFKDFEGLEEALKESSFLDLLPGYLKPIANRIELARGEATGFAHKDIQVLVCAAINEMEESTAESLNWDTLKKWGATLNYARQLGFQVSFADTKQNKVPFKDFEGLEEALEKTNAFGLPDYLKPIASQIEEARGEATGIAHACIQLFVCAAIKEMQDSALGSLNWDTLSQVKIVFSWHSGLGKSEFTNWASTDDNVKTPRKEFSLAYTLPEDHKSSMSFRSTITNLMKQLHDKDNNKVEHEDFPGLKGCITKDCQGEIPDYLKPIGIRIENALRKATEFSHSRIQIVVSAAIKVMEDMSLEDLN
ncbi:hypothetical protein J1N35_024203 [Gossypium stocksii]|uniref:Uncharacterized protein n=1 Tax=Gossypium stocksii TaxID=47602 RepID=A0A9D4A4F2_9ROSI|nr:hypothetical protein J1N35_024203 [Gossypium stocksii]